jgi:nitroreductase
VYGITGTPAFQTILDGLVERNQQWARKAGALIAVISSPTFTRPDGTSAESRSHSFDTGAAWAMIALQANVMGLSTRGMGGIDVKKLQTSLNVPEAYRIEAVVAVGHPGTVELLPEDFQSQEKPTQRNPQSAFVFEGTFKS